MHVGQSSDSCSSTAKRRTAPSRGWRRPGRRRTSLLLEHLQHPVRDEESADDIRHGREQRDPPEDADGRRVLRTRDRDRPDHGDRRDRVRERHERRVEQAGDAADHAQPDEGRQHEHEQHGPVVARGLGRRRLDRHQTVDHHFRTSPAYVTHVSRMISSSKSTTSLPSRVTCNRKLEMFRAYIWLAWYGSVLGRLTGPRIRTPFRFTSVPATASSQFPPVSTARSTMTDPGFMPPTASAVISTGARFPGIAAVVITISASLTCWARKASSRRWVSSDSCFA